MRCSGGVDMKNLISTVMNLVVIAWPPRTDDTHSSETKEFMDQTFDIPVVTT